MEKGYQECAQACSIGVVKRFALRLHVTAHQIGSKSAATGRQCIAQACFRPVGTSLKCVSQSLTIWVLMAAWVFVKNVKLIPAYRMALTQSVRCLQLLQNAKHVYAHLTHFGIGRERYWPYRRDAAALRGGCLEAQRRISTSCLKLVYNMQMSGSLTGARQDAAAIDPT